MENFESLKEHLELFESGEFGRRKIADKLDAIIKKNPLNTDEGRKAYSDKIAECFIPCAKKIFAGHFEVKVKMGEDVLIRRIHPTVLELYYHEEKEGGFKDPIMYHTDYRKRTEKKAKGNTYFSLTGLTELPYYPIGSLNPHTSGIDVTFENAREKYRASFLIRAYCVKYENENGNGKTRTVRNSTEIYDDMLLNGISLENADWIEWVDDKVEVKEIKREWRRNVPDYEKVSDSPEFWNRKPGVEGNKFSVGGGCFARCPFNWQFAKE